MGVTGRERVVLHLVTKQNRALYRAELENLHRVRKSVFVDELGWRLNIENGLEIDQYDDDEAMYGIGFDSAGRISMSGRYRPTIHGSMLADVFAHSLDVGVDSLHGEHVWEFSRGFCLETGGKRHNQQRRAMLMLTPLELAYAHGVTSYIAFSEVRLLPLFINMGWRVNLLGDPVSYGEGEGIAYRVEVSEEAIQSMRRAYDLPTPCYIYLQEDPNDPRDVHERALDIARRAPEYASILPQPTDRPYVPRNLQVRRVDETRLRRRAFDWAKENQAVNI